MDGSGAYWRPAPSFPPLPGRIAFTTYLQVPNRAHSTSIHGNQGGGGWGRLVSLLKVQHTSSGENPANTSTRSLGYVSTSSPSCLLSTPLESSRDHNGLLLKGGCEIIPSFCCDFLTCRRRSLVSTRTPLRQAPTVTDAYRSRVYFAQRHAIKGFWSKQSAYLESSRST